MMRKLSPRSIFASVLPAVVAIALVPSAFSQLFHPQNPAPPPPLPPAQPTQQPPATAFVPPPAPPASRRANIEFVNNVLTINAENSSLDQMLRDIAFLTGMKITGGVADERVFGTYGPDSAQAVLTALLDGTATNILLRETPQHTVAELILTPRNGGPTPPNLNASSSYDRDESDRPQMPGGRRSREFGERRFPVNPEGPQPYSPPAQQAPPATATAPDTTTQQSPNGVKTPQQIYEQLMKQQQPPATAPPQP